MLSTDYFVYVDHDGVEFQAQIIDANSLDLTAELMVYGGPNGAWTVLNVPHESVPDRPQPGAYWKELPGAETDAVDEPEAAEPTAPPMEQPIETYEDPRVEHAVESPTPKEKRATRATR